jgi:lipopolysaccharide biosynthesis protein
MLDADPVRLIAFYLPQFHPIPENEQWWGPGFTEWTNVTRARPQFKGHQQPHLPADLGFYDLRLPDTRRAQADLAREYGITGFCYYHYWFTGRRLLERPFNEVLASGEPDLPFCLCWANEHWTRTWDGFERNVLMDQSYSVEDDLMHIRWLCNAFRDPRYIRVEGRPLFLIYRAGNLPNSVRTTSIWREEAIRQSVGEPFLCRVESFPMDKGIDPHAMGFDAAVEFVPGSAFKGHRVGPTGYRQLDRVLRKARIAGGYKVNSVHSYETLARRALAKPLCGYEQFRCVTPSWDNSARRASGATIMVGSSPKLYREWLEGIVRQTLSKPPDRRIVFINAWNEWAEGNHLEPCQRWGRAYLAATREALLAGSRPIGGGVLMPR